MSRRARRTAGYRLGARPAELRARVTGTVLFGLATLDAVGGLVNPVTVPVKILAFVIWLLGLIAVVRLWQAAPTAYFRTPRS